MKPDSTPEAPLRGWTSRNSGGGAAEIRVTDGKPVDALVTSQPSVPEVAAVLAIGWPFATLALTGILFWIGVPIGPLHLWAALLIALAAGWRFAGDGGTFVRAAGGLTLLALIGGTFGEFVLDFSGDGQWYHLPAILALAEGWNPFQVPVLADWNRDFAQALARRDINDLPTSDYVQHYAKGAWIVAAAAFRATGLLEATKVLNLFYLVAVYWYALALLQRLQVGGTWRHGLAAAFAVNPVGLYQAPSFFVDGHVASLCALCVLVSVEYLLRPRRQTLLLLAACVVLLVNVKFTGAVYAVALLAAMFFLAWLSGQRRGLLGYASTGAAAVLTGVLVLGYQPYVTNVEQRGHPFYPALGHDDGRNVQWNTAPPQFLAMNRAEKLLRSTFAYSSGGEMPRWKPPFTVSKDELYVFFNTEPRYGGFGPLFGSALLLALPVFVLARTKTRQAPWRVGAYLALAVGAAALLNPEAWWARLSPQIWLVPVVLATALVVGAVGWPRRAAAFLIAVLLANAILVAGLNWSRAAGKSLDFRTQIGQLRAASAAGPLEVTIHPTFRMITEHRLRRQSIIYTLVPVPKCAQPIYFSFPVSTRAAACPAGS